jgi:hypothetical protein
MYIFLTPALVWGERSASRPDRFTPGSHCVGGCGLEYPHPSPASSRKRRKGNTVLGGYKYGDLVLQFGGWTQRWRSCSVKRNYCCEIQKVKTGWWIWRNLQREAVAQKGFFSDDDDSSREPQGNLMLELAYSPETAVSVYRTERLHILTHSISSNDTSPHISDTLNTQELCSTRTQSWGSPVSINM